MQYVLVTLVVSLCQVYGSELACKEEVVARNLPMQSCIMSQPMVADWKEKTIYNGTNWVIDRIQCAPGNYTPKVTI